MSIVNSLTVCLTLGSIFSITLNVVLGILGIAVFAKREPVQAAYFLLATLIFLWTIVEFINFQVDPRTMETQEVFFIQQFQIYAIFIAFAYQFIMELPRRFTKG